jgi:hypothetical protein
MGFNVKPATMPRKWLAGRPALREILGHAQTPSRPPQSARNIIS